MPAGAPTIEQLAALAKVVPGGDTTEASRLILEAMAARNGGLDG